jgi:hypothetical protein
MSSGRCCLHAGVAAAHHERRKLERLCRYITRPAIAEPRLSLTPNGNVRYQYFLAVQSVRGNDQFVVHTGHLTKSLRNLPLNGRFTPDMPFANRLANDKIAAELAVRAPYNRYFRERVHHAVHRDLR